MPGGHCEPGESREQTLLRELREEIGVTATAWRPLGRLGGTVPGSTGPVVLHLYAVTGWTGEPVVRAPDELDALARFGVDEACSLALAHPGYPRWFRRVAV